MGKFALECPHCGTLSKASTFIFAKKVITCENCSNEINVKENRMAVGHCGTCGSVAYDQAKGVCPICKRKIVTGRVTSIEDLKKDVTRQLFLCPECGCDIHASKQGDDLVCPVCSYKFDGYEEVFSQIQKGKLVTATGISVIKYEGNNDTFIWKHPIEDFNLGSQLIVHESQEAIFFLNGQALDTFGRAGRYTLETENLPALNKVMDFPTGKQSPFHAEVYFINKTVQMGLKWGTDSHVRFIDPASGIPLDIGASGELDLKVADSRKLLLKLIGTTKGISWESDSNAAKQSLRNAFRPLIMTTVKANLASTIKTEQIDILEIDERLEELSSALGEKLRPGFAEYGLEIARFYVTNIVLPEDDRNFQRLRGLRSAAYLNVQEAKLDRKVKLEEQETELEIAKFEAEKRRITAQGKADVAQLAGNVRLELHRQRGLVDAEIMRAQGYTKKDEIQAEVQKAYAAGLGQMGSGSGSAGGTMVSELMGLGIGMSAMNNLSGHIGEALSGLNVGTKTAPVVAPEKVAAGWNCACGGSGNTGNFCSQCGAAKPDLWDCPHCGAKGMKGNFCAECGKEKSTTELWDCRHCGAKANKGKFCSECGTQKDAPLTWDCECGNKGITGKFCSECGKQKGAQQ